MATKTVSRSDPYAAAMESADALTREVYTRQQEQEEAGRPPYDPVRMLHVWFAVAPRGNGYIAQLRSVVTDNIHRASEEGADFWHPDRGWILYGRKPVHDPGTAIHRRAPGDDSLALPADNEE